MEKQIQEFIDYLKTMKKTSDNTILSYERDLRRMANFMKDRGILSVRAITEDRLMDYTTSLYEDHFAASSITRHNTSIKAFFRYMLENGNIDENPAENLKNPRIEKNEVRVLSTVEIENLLSQSFSDDAKGKRDKAILELMYATGLKSSEMVGLRLSDVDLRIGCIRLKKGAASEKERLIPFGKKAREALSVYLTEGRDELLSGEMESPILFLNCSGMPMSRQGLWKIIKTYVKKAGVNPDITPFTLRHSFAVHLVDNGADVASVQELMGYSDSNTISRYLRKGDKVKDPYQWARMRNL